MNQHVQYRLPNLLWASTAILALALSVGAATPTTQPESSSHIHRTVDIRYGDAAGKSNLLDVYQPDQMDHPYPLVVWVHGGGWAEGDKKWCPASALVHRGFVVASINYRLTDVATYPAQIQDCKGAIRFLRAHADQYRIDPKHIGVWGESAGGHLVALLGTSGDSKEIEGDVGGNVKQSSMVQAVCDWYGPTDLSQFAQQAQAVGIKIQNPGPVLIMKLFGGSLLEKKDLVRQANPLSYISKAPAAQLPPFLIMHGDKDKLVPVAQSQLLADALKTAGATVEIQIIPGAGHGNGFNTPAIAKTVQDFFDKQLK